MIDNASQTERGSGQPYALRKAIETIKSAVPIEDYAAEFTQLRQNGQGLRGCCPVHGGHNQYSFSVDSEKGLWHCFACQDGGDVIDLTQRLEGGEKWEALMVLSTRFNVRLPERSGKWRNWQDEKSRRWIAIRDTLADSYQRRFFRAFYTEYLQEIDDPETRDQEADKLFDGLRSLAIGCATQRIVK
jgi:DNA primase